jgi:hypothetical protein
VAPGTNADYLFLAFCVTTSTDLDDWTSAAGRTPASKAQTLMARSSAKATYRIDGHYTLLAGSGVPLSQQGWCLLARKNGQSSADAHEYAFGGKCNRAPIWAKISVNPVKTVVYSGIVLLYRNGPHQDLHFLDL